MATALGSALLVASFAAPAAAQEPSVNHLAAARDLVLAVGASNSIDRIVPALANDMRRQLVTRPELTKDLDEVLKSLDPELDLQRQQAIAVAARVYAKYLTEQEARDLTTFFKSPAGAKYVRLLPDITEDLVNTMSGWSQIAAEYIQTRVRAEMLKRGHQLQ